MIELEKTFIGKTSETKDFLFRQVCKNDFAFMYEVKSYSNENGNILTYYEVFERRITSERDTTIDGVNIHFVEKEIYPKSNYFGIWAWTYYNYEKALCKFNEISVKGVENIQNKE